MCAECCHGRVTEEGSVNSLDGTIASPGEQRPGYVRRKRWAVTSSEHSSAASEETMDTTTGLPPATLKKLHLSEKDLTAPTGIQTAAFPASTQVCFPLWSVVYVLSSLSGHVCVAAEPIAG